MPAKSKLSVDVSLSRGQSFGVEDTAAEKAEVGGTVAYCRPIVLIINRQSACTPLV